MEINKITVWDLKEYLRNIPDDYVVILSKDGEGNMFSPLAGGTALGNYRPDNSLVGDFEFDDQQASCVVFFPVS